LLTTVVDFFDAATLPTNMHLLGDAVFEVQGGNSFVTLVPAKPGKTGSVYIDGPGTPVRNFIANLRYSVKDGIDPTDDNTGNAAGISFGYGTIQDFDPGGLPTSFGEDGPGLGDGVWLSINTRAGSPDLGIRVLQGDTPALTISIGNIDLRGDFREVAFEITASGLVTLSHPAIPTQSVQLMNWDPQPTWRFGVGARTSDETDWHVLEDLAINDRTRPDEPITVSETSRWTRLSSCK
jgi:hypothetical protein